MPAAIAGGPMATAEVVKRKPARYSGPLIFPVLVETIRESGESPKVHPNGEVLALHDASADTLGIGLSEYIRQSPRTSLRRALPARAPHA